MQKLYRSETDKIIFGVCGGFGEYFEVDPVLVRLVFILFAFMGGGGLLLYLLLALVIPKNPMGAAEVSREEKIKDFAHKAGEKVSDLAQEIGHGAKTTFEFARENRREKKKSSFFGIILITIGLIFLVNMFVPAYWMGNRLLWPLTLIIFGLYLIVRKSSGEKMVEHHHHHNHSGAHKEDKKEAV